MGWGRRGEEGSREKDICIPMADYIDILQKTAKFCKAIILKLKPKKKKATAGHMGLQLLFQQCLHSEEYSGDIENRILFFLIS